MPIIGSVLVFYHHQARRQGLRHRHSWVCMPMPCFPHITFPLRRRQPGDWIARWRAEATHCPLPRPSHLSRLPLPASRPLTRERPSSSSLVAPYLHSQESWRPPICYQEIMRADSNSSSSTSTSRSTWEPPLPPVPADLRPWGAEPFSAGFTDVSIHLRPLDAHWRPSARAVTLPGMPHSPGGMPHCPLGRGRSAREAPKQLDFEGAPSPARPADAPRLLGG
jgi:hypothetical protein